MMPPDQLSSLLSALLAAGEGAIPLKIELREDKEVIALRNQIEALNAKISSLETEHNRIEFTMKCFYTQNQEMIELLRLNGIRYRKTLFSGFDDYDLLKD